MGESESVHIVLIGPMGVGKTTVGSELAARIGRAFIDADEELERLHGSTGAELAASAGVEILHARELEVFRRMVASREPSVIAAPTSVIDADEGRDHLRRAVAVWLDADAATLALRSSTSSHRRSVDAAEAARLRANRVHLVSVCTVGAIDASGPVEECVELIMDAIEPWFP